MMKKSEIARFLAPALLSAAMSTSCTGLTQSETAAAVTNPIDINYRFSMIKNEPPRREAADPEIVLYKDRYYLFASKSGGYWSSPDLKSWRYIKFPEGFPTENYAPTAEVIGGDLVFFTSGHDTFWKSSDPEGGKWERIPTKYPRRDTDPDLFRDDDGRVYIYWGCSPKDPIMGAEIDPKDGFKIIGEPVELIGHGFKTNGWEKPGANNEEDKAGWNEGANMIKHGGKYYLQFAAPGTQWRSYGDGYYVSDRPLGPFKYAPNSPFSIKPGGFVGSAGHGATFRDRHGNYWHVASMLVGVRHGFERRLGLFPTFFDREGRMYSVTEMTDRPFAIPDRKMDFSRDSLSTGLALLSFKKPVSASSQKGALAPENAVDEKIETWWSAETGRKGERLQIDLGRPASVHSVHVNFADEGFDVYGDAPAPVYRYKILASQDGKSWQTVADKSQNSSDAPHTLVNLKRPAKARYIAIENAADLDGGQFSLSGLRVFGKSDIPAPKQVSGLRAARGTDDRRNIEISWNPSEGAEGYVLRWGVEKDRLHNARTLRETSVKGSFLNVGQPYFFTVEPFNAGGFGKPSQAVHVAP